MEPGNQMIHPICAEEDASLREEALLCDISIVLNIHQPNKVRVGSVMPTYVINPSPKSYRS